MKPNNKIKSFLKNKSFIFTLVGIGIGGILFGIGLLWGWRFDFVGFINATTFATLLLFALSWLLFVSNHGLFDILIYGTQMFFKGIVGKRMPQSYYDYTTNKRKTPKHILIGFSIAALIFLIALGILYLIYYS